MNSNMNMNITILLLIITFNLSSHLITFRFLALLWWVHTADKVIAGCHFPGTLLEQSQCLRWSWKTLGRELPTATRVTLVTIDTYNLSIYIYLLIYIYIRIYNNSEDGNGWVICIPISPNLCLLFPEQAELSFRFVLICETVLWISSHEVPLAPSTQKDLEKHPIDPKILWFSWCYHNVFL